MNKVKLKICGITSLDDALLSIECGAEYLGFNFYAGSPRYILPQRARSIIKQLPVEIMTVGIFVNEPSPEDVLGIMEASGVQLAQLHGDESPGYCGRVGSECVIKALRVGADFAVANYLEYPATAILLDAFDKNLYGGTGKPADWRAAAEVGRKVRLFLAGGISPENVSEAVSVVSPFAVDVNSGVESEPGRKDPQKLKRLREELDKL